MRIVLVRHPPTALNEDPVRLRGGLDVPLSKEGAALIPSIVTGLRNTYPHVACVYSSPLRRAEALAEAIADAYPSSAFQTLYGLSSRDYGVLNGQPVADVLPRLKELSEGEGMKMAPEGGESMHNFLVRVRHAACHISYEYSFMDDYDKTVVVVTHLQNVMILRAMFAQGLPYNKDLQYTYTESSEIKPGEWIEMTQRWQQT